jgi:hypothetical protein
MGKGRETALACRLGGMPQMGRTGRCGEETKPPGDSLVRGGRAGDSGVNTVSTKVGARAKA